MSTTRIAAAIVGLALLGIGWAIDGIWETPEPWVLWIVFGISVVLLLLAALWPKSRNRTGPQSTTVEGHSANVDLSKNTAGRDITVNIGDQIHVKTGTIDPVSKRDLSAEQRIAQGPPQTEAVNFEDWGHWPEVDLPTAAAIWSGSWDPGNAHRHVCFRNLKWAIKNGHLRPHKLHGPIPNIQTTVTPADLKKFFDHWDQIRTRQLPDDPRLKLAQLRTVGVEIRNNARATDAPDFCSRASEWANETVYQIENIDPPDAEWFKTLDAVPPPRVKPPNDISEDALKCFRELDFRLKKLDDLIQKYGGN